MEFIVIFIATFLLILVILLRPAGMTDKQREFMEGKNFAHRGLHSQDLSVPENSLAAFKAAADAGYAMELDIQLTKDGHVVVFHDDTTDRVCGREGRVRTMMLQELKRMRLHETDERIPTLDEVLKAVDGRTTIVVELKASKANIKLCEKAYAILSKYDGPYCIESFHPQIVSWFKRNAPEVVRGQLVDNFSEYKEIPLIKRWALESLVVNVVTRPHYIAHGMTKKSIFVRFVELMGAMPMVWTVKDEKDMLKAMDENRAVVFENFLPSPTFGDNI